VRIYMRAGRRNECPSESEWRRPSVASLLSHLLPHRHALPSCALPLFACPPWL